MVEELRRQQIEAVKEKIKKAKKKRRRRLILIPCLLLLAIGGFLAYQISLNQHLETTYYQLNSEKVDTDIKIVVLSDLHSMEYGSQNRELVEAIRKEKPDLIAMIGDMVNEDDVEFSVIQNLCQELKEIAPIYYTLGNHEGTLMYGRMDSVALDEMLEEEGVTVLINQSAEFTKGDTTICLAGISIEAAGYDKWAKAKMDNFWKKRDYKVVLSHFPDLYYSKLKDADFDLAFAGHYHGGLIRIPKLGGIYHPEEGFFPEYAGGQYALTNGTLIVSRGIGGHGKIPRINNRPELVVVEIN